MFGRVYKTRLVLFAVIFVAFFLIIKSNLSSVQHIDIPKEAFEEQVFTRESFSAEVCQDDKCPVCFGKDACPDLLRGLEISKTLYNPEKEQGNRDGGTDLGVYQVFKGADVKYWARPLSSQPLQRHAMNSFEDFVCRNASGKEKSKIKACELTAAAEQSVLYTAVLDNAFLRNLYRGHLVSRHRVALTACPTQSLTHALVKAFDLNQDDALTAEEKSVLITSVAVNPDVAAHRLLQNQGVRVPLINFYGTCGRVTLLEPSYRPLTSFLDQSLEVRKDLASQIIQLIDTFLNEDPSWLLFTADVTVHNFVVTTAGQVVFKDLSRLMMLDRSTFVNEDYGKTQMAEEDECDFKCLEKLYNALIEGQETTGCYSIHKTKEYMFALACRNIFSDMELERSERHHLNDQRGLLHTIQNDDEVEEVNNLIRECIDENERGNRLDSVINLKELFGATFDDSEDDDEGEEDLGGEQDYENGNVVHMEDADQGQAVKDSQEEEYQVVQVESGDADDDGEKDANMDNNKEQDEDVEGVLDPRKVVPPSVELEKGST